MYTSIGVLSALVERASSGEGQHVDVAMLDSQIALMENPVVRHFATGEIQPRAGLRHPLSTPHQAFPASDAWFVVAGVRDRNWQLFCGLIGADELAVDERFSENALRTANYEALEPLMFEATRRMPREHWLEVLKDEFLVGPINNIAEAVRDPQVQHRNMLRELPTWTGEMLTVSNTPVKHSRTRGGAERGAPAPGEHSREVLGSVGFLETELDDLVARGVIAVEPASE
jgi:crotonobetainyl-CoA:carnitine CoA-transferase CaiB-like acyl-CoA transferase